MSIEPNRRADKAEYRFWKAVARRRAVRLLVVAVLACCCHGCGAAQYPRLVAPDFSKGERGIKGMIGEHRGWELSNGCFKSTGGVGNCLSFPFGDPLWQDYELSFRIKRIKVGAGDQHFDIFVRQTPGNELRFYCRGDSLYYLELLDGKEQRHELIGKLPAPMKIGQDAPWTSFRVAVTGNRAEVYVDNAKLGTLDSLVLKNGSASFLAYNLDVWLDGLKAIVTKVATGSEKNREVRRNLLHNSGFELCTLDRLPDFWGCPHWGISDAYWATRYDEWTERFGTDAKEAFEGLRSMRIDNPFDREPGSGLLLQSVVLGTKVKAPYVFSAYLKSRPAGMKVNFIGREVTLSDHWTRYSSPFLNDGSGLYADMAVIYPLSKGTFWIDAAQLETGSTASAYQPSLDSVPLMTQEGNVEKKITEVPKSEPQRITGGLKLDGRLNEREWTTTARLELGGLGGGRPAEATELRILYSSDGIYLGLKCAVTGTQGGGCKVAERDGCVWNDPSIEIFLDPNLTRNYYYHLAFNQQGVQSDSYRGDFTWNGTWRVATYTGNGFWSAELFIPFGDLGLDRGTGEWWGLNVGRNGRAEVSCWSPTYASFHTPERFGQIRIDQEVLRAYCVRCDGAELIRGAGGQTQVSASVMNNSGAAGTFVLDAQLKDVHGQRIAAFAKPVQLANGETKTVVLGEIAGNRAAKYIMRNSLLTGDKSKVLNSGDSYLEIPPAFTLMPQYDLYTGEPEMLIRASFNLAETELKGARLSLEINGAAGGQSLNHELAKLDREMEFKTNISSLPCGTYALKAKLTDASGRVLDTWSGSFRKLAPQANETKIDHLARMIVVDGKPFIPVGFFWEGALPLELLAYLAASGCNTVEIKIYPDTFDVEKVGAVLDNAAKCGLKVRLSVAGKERGDAEKVLLKFKGHPALIAWAIFDEVFTVSWGKENYQTVKERCAELKALDPYHPVHLNENRYGLNYLQGQNLEFPGDIISVDHYIWVPSGSFQTTSDCVRTMEAMGRRDGRPSWMYLLGAGYAFWVSRDYTPAEQEFSVYTSLINGATGILYFASHPKSKSHWARIKGLFKEMKELTPVIASTLKAPAITCTAPDIQAMTKRYGPALYLLTVNSSSLPQTARFDLSALGHGTTAVTVLFENREVVLKDGILEDKFDGFRRHVYVIPSVP